MAPVVMATPTGFDFEETPRDERCEKTKPTPLVKTKPVKQENKIALKEEYATKIEPRKEKIALIDCPICLEKHILNDAHTFGCCNMHVCKHCHKELTKRADMTEKSDPLGTAHPESIAYALDLTNEAFDKILRYQKATQNNEPNWDWHKVGEHDYFLEGGTLWRYAREEAPDDDEETLYSGPWRYITPPRCPFCYKCHQHNHE